jgi:hypothetical protein
MAWTVEVWANTGAYVIRAEPWNAYQEGLGSNWGGPYRFLERLLTRNHSWTVRVRARGDDPFGLVQYTEIVKKRQEAATILRRVERDLHRGVTPRDLATP